MTTIFGDLNDVLCELLRRAPSVAERRRQDWIKTNEQAIQQLEDQMPHALAKEDWDGEDYVSSSR